MDLTLSLRNVVPILLIRTHLKMATSGAECPRSLPLYRMGELYPQRRLVAPPSESAASGGFNTVFALREKFYFSFSPPLENCESGRWER